MTIVERSNGQDYGPWPFNGVCKTNWRCTCHKQQSVLCLFPETFHFCPSRDSDSRPDLRVASGWWPREKCPPAPLWDQNLCTTENFRRFGMSSRWEYGCTHRPFETLGASEQAKVLWQEKKMNISNLSQECVQNVNISTIYFVTWNSQIISMNIEYEIRV